MMPEIVGAETMLMNMMTVIGRVARQGCGLSICPLSPPRTTFTGS